MAGDGKAESGDLSQEETKAIDRPQTDIPVSQ
jgi:hypothetical protein